LKWEYLQQYTKCIPKDDEHPPSPFLNPHTNKLNYEKQDYITYLSENNNNKNTVLFPSIININSESLDNTKLTSASPSTNEVHGNFSLSSNFEDVEEIIKNLSPDANQNIIQEVCIILQRFCCGY
jgi:hypothetical protein